MKPAFASPTTKTTSKSQDIHGQLVEMATALGPNAKMPTVSQLRRELSVSITTLDGVLKQLESQNIIFKKQGSGIFVSPKVHQKCVGLVCDPAFFSAGTSPFWQQLIEAARKRASLGGEAFRFYLAMASSDGSMPIHDDLIEDVDAGRIQGVLFLGNNEKAQEWLAAHKVASVVFAGKGEHRVEIDVTQLIDMAGSHLTSQGCKRLALFCPCEVRANQPVEDDVNSEWPDVRAFRKYHADTAMELDDSLIWDARKMRNRVATLPETHQEQGYQAITAIFDGQVAPPDGLISTDDMMTRGILAGLRKLGLTPGKQLKIVSHTNKGSTVLTGEDENIQFVEIDPASIVAQMFSTLELLMDNDTTVQPGAAFVGATFRDQ